MVIKKIVKNLHLKHVTGTVDGVKIHDGKIIYVGDGYICLISNDYGWDISCGHFINSMADSEKHHLIGYSCGWNINDYDLKHDKRLKLQLKNITVLDNKELEW